MKRCLDCNTSKPLDAFGQNKTRPDGRAAYCKQCFRARSRAQYRKRRAALGRPVREPQVVPEGMKRCPRCEGVKSLTAFHVARRQAGGRASWCAECKNADQATKRLFKQYGLTRETLDQLVASQGGSCAICRAASAQHVDHDHLSGEVRGVLCFRCNAALGLLDDDLERLRSAYDYVERTTWQRVQAVPGGSRSATPTPAPRASSTSSPSPRPASSPGGETCRTA